MGDTLQDTSEIYEFGPYRLDPRVRVLLKGRDVVPLTPKVLDTLLVLVKKAGQPVSKEELLRSVWPDSFVEESNLAQNISVLRKALGQASGDGVYIETIPKRGYRFVPEVRTAAAAPSPVAPEDEAPAHAQPTAVATPRLRRRSVWAALAAIAICATGTIAWRIFRQAHGRHIRSIAVLPLRNLSGDPQQEYFADGITEVLTAELSKTLRIRVTSATSAMSYRQSDKNLPAIAQELNVDGVLEGSVIRSGSHLRVTAQLIEAATDRHLWAETYDREVVEVPTLQTEIARAVAHEIGGVTSVGGRSPRAPVNREALEAYLRARYYLDQRTGPEIAKAVEWLKKAIEADPAYAPAYAGLGDCYNQFGTVMVGGARASDSRKLGFAAATRALEIDPDLAEAHATLAYSSLYDWHWAEAKAGFERAIALNPNYAPAHLWYAHYLTARGEFDRGQQEVRLAMDLDPLSPIIHTQVAWLLGHARRYEESIAEFRKVLAQDPNYQWALWQLGSSLMAAGDYEEGIRTLERAVAVRRTPSALGTLGEAYGRAGRLQDAQKVLMELLALGRDGYVPPHALVHVYLGLGDREKVFEWMEKAYQERSNSLLWMNVGRLFDSVRSDPRFDAYLARVGLK